MATPIVAINEQTNVLKQQGFQNDNFVNTDNIIGNGNLSGDSVSQFGKVFDSNGMTISTDQYSNTIGEYRNFNQNAVDGVSGDAINGLENQAMDLLKNVRAKFDAIRTDIERLSSKQDISQADMMKLQCSIIELSYLADLSAKTADKMSQAAQTLFRNQ